MNDHSTYTLADWYGKADDVTINYNTYLSPIQHDETDNELTEAIWEETVNQADKADYIIAISCGMIAGVLDIFFVGQFSLERAPNGVRKK